MVDMESRICSLHDDQLKQPPHGPIPFLDSTPFLNRTSVMFVVPFVPTVLSRSERWLRNLHYLNGDVWSSLPLFLFPVLQQANDNGSIEAHHRLELALKEM